MKRVAALLALLGMIAGALWLWHRPQGLAPTHAELPSSSAPSAAGPKSDLAPAPIPPTEGALLDAASQAAVRECLGKPASSWKELNQEVESLAIGPAHWLWKVASVEEEGNELRLRLEAKDSGPHPQAYEVRLFSVDEEGLPDPLPARPGQQDHPEAWFDSFLAGKEILHEASRDELVLPGGRKAEREKADGLLEEVQVTGPGQELNCALRTDSPGCTCHREQPQG